MKKDDTTQLPFQKRGTNPSERGNIILNKERFLQALQETKGQSNLNSLKGKTLALKNVVTHPREDREGIINIDGDGSAQMNIQAVENELQGCHSLKQGPLELKNRHPAHEHVYRWSPVENREVYQRVMYVLKNNTGYILTATFSKKTWKILGSEIDKIFRSFTIG